MFTNALVVFSVLASVLGTPYITSPTGSTTFVGGQQATVSWQEDNSPPTLADFGVAKISIYVGNAKQQTPLQLINGNVDVSKVTSVQFVPDPTIGPNGSDYFVRIESLNAKDPKEPQFPALTFSAKFTMSGMSGTFNASVIAQIEGQSTAPLSGPTAAVASSSGSASANPTGSKTTSGGASTGSATRSGTSATASQSHNAAITNVNTGLFGLLMSAIVGAAML
ncbi:hypothetical protein AMATHDRAFT_60326 [Amanita thiersii Skay4041]|uniref:Yeast cell wall synthesis Kre9/Knh1-like N-terminal domain-containing protein n=1 Tax=Amanita thiersii Skay4041 TaxID=703135 RepID=A0A2A9NT30_9AGAR|nr:hypothetical protein AMATHDRAFT_60326 [Amanita thiersii Skay4041]